MKKFNLILMSVAALLMVSPASALTFPDRNDKAVVDAAHVIPVNQANALNHQLVQWEQKTHHQLVVTTIPSLEGTDISDYGYQLGRHWKLGQTGVDDAAIIILAPSERKVRIEVAKGFEPVLTDAVTTEIRLNDITPLLKTGDIGGALTKGAQSIMTYVDAHQSDMITSSSPAASSNHVATWIMGLLFGLLGLGGVVHVLRRRKTPSVKQDGTSGAPPYSDAGVFKRNDYYNNYYTPPLDLARYPTPAPDSGLTNLIEGAAIGAVVDEVFRKKDDTSSSDLGSSSFDTDSSSDNSSSSSSDDSFGSSNSDDTSFGGGGSDGSY